MITLFLLAQVADNTAFVKDNAAQTNIIGLGGIIATIIVGILTCFVTWIVAMRSIKQMKLTYNMKSYPILTNDINIHNTSQTNDFKIYYKDDLLETPCLLAVDIENIRNKAIENPPIKISNTEDIKMIPGYFENLSEGYENIWSVESVTQNSCKLFLQHINPKQTAHLRIYLNKYPQKEFKFECPMADLQIQKGNSVIESYSKFNMKRDRNFVINIALIAIALLFFITIDSWRVIIDELIWYTGAKVSAVLSIVFVIAVLILAVILNICKPQKTTALINKHKRGMVLISLGMVIISFILLYLIVYNTLIITMASQFVTAIVTLLMQSISIHILTIVKSNSYFNKR